MNMAICIKRDNILVDFMLKHKGKENAVSSKEICNFLSKEGFNCEVDSVHSILKNIIKQRHLPICSLNSRGYYWAKTKDDVLSCISHLEKRITALQEHIAHLFDFIIE
jgi:hypothetical protein